MRYFIEQAPDKFYDDLRTAKARARRISKQRDDLVYVIAERFDPEARDYAVVGSVSFAHGYQDSEDGVVAP